MVALAVAFFTTLNAIIGIINGFRPAYSEAGKLLSHKAKTEGEKECDKIITWLRWVERKVQEELTHRTNSKCSETKITADLKPLVGELTEARSLVKTWQNKNCWGKRLALKEFEEKWEKSEKAIRRRLQEFWSYTQRYKETQHTSRTAKRTTHTSGTAKRTTQHTNISVKKLVINGNVNWNGNVNLNLKGSAAQPYNRHQLRMENGNRNRLLMDNGNQSPLERGHEKVDKGHNRKPPLRMEKENNGPRSPMEKGNQSPMERGHEKVDKGHNRKPQGSKEFEKPERFHMVPNKRGKQNGAPILNRF